jgi:hypothetical protein
MTISDSWGTALVVSLTGRRIGQVLRAGTFLMLLWVRFSAPKGRRLVCLANMLQASTGVLGSRYYTSRYYESRNKRGKAHLDDFCSTCSLVTQFKLRKE